MRITFVLQVPPSATSTPAFLPRIATWGTPSFSTQRTGATHYRRRMRDQYRGPAWDRYELSTRRHSPRTGAPQDDDTRRAKLFPVKQSHNNDTRTNPPFPLWRLCHCEKSTFRIIRQVSEKWDNPPVASKTWSRWWQATRPQRRSFATHSTNTW